MNDNETFTVYQQMPRLNFPINFSNGTSTADECRTYQGKFKFKNNAYRFISEGGREIFDVQDWRYIKEKRPDFDKLKWGDLIKIEENFFTENFERVFVGFVYEMNEEEILISDCYHHHAHNQANETTFKLKDIKRVTRINVRDKTFEEI